MGKLDLRIRDLNTGDTANVPFDNELAAREWLAKRPRFMEPLGVATHGITEETSQRLKAAMRPLDDEEKQLRQEIDAAIAEAEAAREAEAEKLEVEAMKAHAETQRTADPNRPMALHYTFDHGLELADPTDPREITPAARDAAMGWVRERDEWVKDRGQVVGDATVTVYPGPVPSGEDRILPGARFSPVTAPKN